ncbi:MULTISPECIES: hypothetical protein [unclassified Streptomyces]|uniref:hypothetical protein n=1 Tax=unclassified Streptomyces TaxID=2593676 RepID=UPI00101B79CB|nr:hypothetical protein [Streptomyces sp. L-9-10]RYJ24898.1 hypothetical protein CU044_4809 [Streptomyces sp. L-9-10]
MRRRWRWWSGVVARLVERRRQRLAYRRLHRALLSAFQEPDEAVLFEKIFGHPPPEQKRMP